MHEIHFFLPGSVGLIVVLSVEGFGHLPFLSFLVPLSFFRLILELQLSLN
jgi:hypothetical protein